MDKLKLYHILKTKAKQYRIQKYLITKPAQMQGVSSKVYLAYTTNSIPPSKWAEALERNMTLPATDRELLVVSDRVAKLKASWKITMENLNVKDAVQSIDPLRDA